MPIPTNQLGERCRNMRLYTYEQELCQRTLCNRLRNETSEPDPVMELLPCMFVPEHSVMYELQCSKMVNMKARVKLLDRTKFARWRPSVWELGPAGKRADKHHTSLLPAILSSAEAKYP